MYCKKCGTPMMPVYSRRKGWTEVCIKCGEITQTEAVSYLDQTAAEHAYRGWNYFAVQDFDAATENFRKAAEFSGGWPEYLWAALLAEYGIKYCKTEHGEGGEQYTANFWKREMIEKLLVENAEFKTVCDVAASGDIADLRYYQKEARKIDRGLQQICRISAEEEYDIFISFKDLDANGEHTPERKLCDGLYQELVEMGYRVFYSPRAMYGKVVTDFEGYIYKALRKSMLMVLVASSSENAESPWVKSEWQRFLRWNAEEDYRLITCRIGNMQPEEFPEELKQIQHDLRAREDQLNEISVLKWFSGEIEKRYRKLAQKQDEAEESPKEIQNDAEIQYRLDKQYHESEGVELDYARAVEHLQKAAEQRDAKAQNSMGFCYKYGDGVDSDSSIDSMDLNIYHAEQNDMGIQNVNIYSSVDLDDINNGEDIDDADDNNDDVIVGNSQLLCTDKSDDNWEFPIPSFSENSDLIHANEGGDDGQFSAHQFSGSPVLMRWDDENTIWGNAKLHRSEVIQIHFKSNICDAPEDAWDMSEQGNRTILGWVEKLENDLLLYIAANGDIYANTDSSGLFQGYSELKEIKFNGHFNTSHVTNMREMFKGCESLIELNLNGFDTSNVTDMADMFAECRSLTELDLNGFDTSNVANMKGMFDACNSLTELDLNGFDTSNVVNMKGMFLGCHSLTELDLSGFDTSNVIEMSRMFVCKSLTELDLSGFDTSNVTDMSGMFDYCKSLTRLDLSSFDTSNVTDMYKMFDYCKSLTRLDLSGFDTSNVTDMACMFAGCESLTGLDLSGFDTSNVNYMPSMFAGCESLTRLDVSGFDTSNVTNIHSMFDDCKSLTRLDVSGFDTSNVNYMPSMFAGCESLTELDVSGFDTSNITNMCRMFAGCKSLTELDLSGFDTSNVTSMGSMFAGCASLTGLDLRGFDTSNVICMDSMFTGCESLTGLDLSSFDTSEIIDMEELFSGCKSLVRLDLSNFNTSYHWLFEEKKSMKGMFRGCESLTELLLNSFNTSHVTDMGEMFNGCKSLTRLDLSNFNTSNVATMQGMFKDCESLIELLLNSFDTSHVTDMSEMFNGCKSLTRLDLSNFSTSNVANMQGMFKGCESLTELDLSGFDTSNVTDMSEMFRRCSALKKPDLTGFDISDETEVKGMFYGCSSLVKVELPAYLDNYQKKSDLFDEDFNKLTVFGRWMRSWGVK